ncbi:MAG TPA: shikimate dehydrogenase [Actinomycetota bacterium]|nr:shikimate dehydrogenase [Actinomycetota bacterium]
MGKERRTARVGGSTRTVGVIGWPASGSLSPVIHNAAFAALGLDWVYVPLPVPPGELRAALPGLVAVGFAGANITMPHKTEAASLVRDLSEDAERLRAVNTIVVGPAGLSGHNTDTPGFDRFLRRDAGFDPAGRTALVFGAGGAARACALALARGGVERLLIAVREPSRAEPLVRMLVGLPSEVRVGTLESAEGADVDLVVNATPVGAEGEVLPLPRLHPDVLVVDLLYRPSATPLLSVARARGAQAFGGLGLLLHQAALSFELWTGREPPLAVMSAAALAALAEMAETAPRDAPPPQPASR